jgi:hypothetical protein
MAFSATSSIGLIALAVGSVATGSLWSQRDQRAIDAPSTGKHMLSSACLAGKGMGETGADTARSTAGCQAYFQSYWPNASWEAMARTVGR